VGLPLSLHPPHSRLSTLLGVPMLTPRASISLPYTRYYVRLNALLDDGGVFYLNGQEVWRVNMPKGTVTSSTLASRRVDGTAQTVPNIVLLPGAPVVEGVNILAVEVPLLRAGWERWVCVSCMCV
jgi:hypothetical protein